MALTFKSNIYVISLHANLRFTACLSILGVTQGGADFPLPQCLLFWRYLHTVLHSGCTNLQSYHPCRRVPFCSTSYPAFVVSRLFDDSHSDQCEVVPHVILICISLIISDAEHLFMCLLAICMSSLEKCLFRSSAHFLTRSFCYCCYWVVWAVWKVTSFANIFSHLLIVFSFFLMVSFTVQKLISVIRSHFKKIYSF